MSTKTYTEEEIQELTDRVFVLKEKIEAGKMHFADHLIEDFRRSLEAIRLRADGRVDPATVDSRIRTTVLALRAMTYREDEKRHLSLAQIQEAYFDLLFREFGTFYDAMSKVGATPTAAGVVTARNDKFVKDMRAALPELATDLREFWSSVADAGAFHLQDGRQLKATFAGDVFPAHWENAVSTAGLYVDTIILPCPITRLAPLVGLIPDEELASVALKHILTAMTYRELATADLDPPIVVVLPNQEDFDQDTRRGLFDRAEPATRKHAEYLFGRPFESIAHLREFCSGLATIDQVLRELKGHDRLLLNVEWNRDPRAQLAQAIAERAPAMPGMDPGTAGSHVFGACLGRMPQALAAQENATYLGGTPLINAETSWLYYTWLLEYEGAAAPKGERTGQSMHVVRALASERRNLEWLGNVPPEKVLEIRRRGLAEEVRAILSRGVQDLIGVHPGNYFRTTDQVVENLERAFEEHQRQLLEAKQKKLMLYGIDVGSCVAVGTVAVAAALTGNPMLGAASGILGVVGLPNLRDIKTKYLAIAEEDRTRRSSPTGLLFSHVKRSE